MIIDAHQHFWTLRRDDYGWLTPDLTDLYRDFQPRDLEPILLASGVEATVIVQAAPTEAETVHLLELARRWPIARGVVGWSDLTSPRVAHNLDRLADNPLLRGIRPMIQDEADPDWMLHPSVASSLQVMGECRLTFDALVGPRHLGPLKLLIDLNPCLPVVIDHGGKPPIASGGYEPWAEDMRALSERPQVACKLSGLLTEAGARAVDADLRPYVEHLLECFGPARLMWGSDWPVLTAVGGYGAWLDQARRLVGALSADEQAQVFGRTAASFYGI